MSDWWSERLSGTPAPRQPGYDFGSGRWAPPPPPPPPRKPTSVSEALAQGAVNRRASEEGNCPNCGSGNYFSRKNAAAENVKEAGGQPPAPRCFECGYTGGAY